MRPFNHPFNTEACCKRLYDEYLRHHGLIVAFDFDNTIFDYHNDGGDYSCVIDLLKEASREGFTMVLFTTELDDAKLNHKVKYCEDTLGFRVDYVNESPLWRGSAKPYYNVLLDDRAGLESAYTALSYVMDKIKESKN